MDAGTKKVRVQFSGVGQEDQGSSGWPTKPVPPQQGTPLGRGEDYDAAYAATVAAVAHAIAAMEEQNAPSHQKVKPIIPEKASSRKKEHVTVHTPTAAAPPLSLVPPPKRGESAMRPAEGSSSKISRWFSGKEQVVEDGDDDGFAANVSVRRPVQKKPEGLTTPGQTVVGRVVDPVVPNVEKDPRKRSRRFEQEQLKPMVADQVNPTSTSFPPERKESRRYEQQPPANQSAPPSGRPAVSSDAERMAVAWEKEMLAKIQEQYDEMMETIAEWEGEKKVKARRQKEAREGGSEGKQAKALEEYNEEMKRINKVAATSRLRAEEKKRSAEGKVRQKAARIRSTGKLPRSRGCF